MEIRPHDLLRLSSPDAIAAIDPPAWVGASLVEAPWVVVRRSSTIPGRIAVGVRGSTRTERFAAFVSPDDLAEALAPKDLRDRVPERPHPAFEAIARLRPWLDETSRDWGPAGAAGYELATRRPALTGTSDLDLVVRFDRLPATRQLRALAAAAAATPLRVDILVETPHGAVALAELVSGAPELLLRTAEGPRLALRAKLTTSPC